MDEIKPKYSEWLSEYTFDNCAVGRKAYGEFLASFLAEEKDGFVLNLNGKWGTGKTEFLKRLYTHFHNANHPVIYIDAWESDFTDNPLLVVASELLTQLKALLPLHGNDLDKLKKHLGKLLKGSAIVAGSYIGEKFIGDAAAGREFVKTFMESSPKEYLDSMKKGYSEQVEAVKEVRKHLEQLAVALNEVHKRQLPVMVLVDELDRCRPNYAIEMLEVIKHFFSTKDFVFVVATDTEQLQNSINAVYGEKFESEAYLRRFFDRKSVLSPPDVDKFLGHYEFDHHENVQLYPDNSHFDRDPIEIVNFKMLARAYSLGLRDIDQLVAKYKACIRSIASNKEQTHVVNIFTLLVALIEFDRRPDKFENRDTDNPLSNWDGEDFTISTRDESRKTTFKDYYKLNVDYSVLHTLRAPDSGHEQLVKAYRLPQFQYNPTHTSSLLLHTKTSLVNNLNTSQAKILIWNSYRELVRLSGTIQ